MDEQQSETARYPQDVDSEGIDRAGLDPADLYPADVQPDVVGDDRTGMPSVDAVLDEVAALSARPVPEHVAVFERAHEQLRRALDAQPDA